MTRSKFVIWTTFGVSLGGGVVGIVTAQDNAAAPFVAGFFLAVIICSSFMPDRGK